METISRRPGEDLLDLGKRCNAVYVCPTAGSKRLGPLVAYAGKDKFGRNLVGDIFFNFRRIESHPKAVLDFAEAAGEKLTELELLSSFDTVCGVPHGGRSFGQMLALVTGKRFTYADKVPKPTEAGKKQEYTWDLSQFQYDEGERVAIAEDVFNNFMNTDNTLDVFAATGAKVTLLVGALNRSPFCDHAYAPKGGIYAGMSIPVVASIRQPYPEYEQDDLNVIADIGVGNVEFEVKKNWSRLVASMQR